MVGMTSMLHDFGDELAPKQPRMQRTMTAFMSSETEFLYRQWKRAGRVIAMQYVGIALRDLS